ncbi:MAG: transcription termination factor NusA [Sphaerochaetaceae bacterium]|nr:transcription termination factor NusA [Sphaerochaetaceae bacterium]
MSNLSDAINEMVNEKNIALEQVLKTIEQTLLASYKKKYGRDDNASVRFDPNYEEVHLIATKTVVDEPEDALDKVIEISLNKALEINENAEEGDVIEIVVNFDEFDRGSIQSGKQKAQQSIRDFQKNELMTELKEKEGKLIVGIVQNERNGDLFVEIGKTQAILPRRNQSPRDNFIKGDKIKCLLESVAQDERNPRNLRIVLTRTSDEFIEEIFKQYIPELQEPSAAIGIEKIVREPGYRTKISVYPKRENVDPVGTCVGLGGQRIKSIIVELNGELIDVLRYDEDPATYIQNALSPAKVLQVFLMDPQKRTSIAVVDESQLSLAIGKMGINVRLVNRLCDWLVDVRTPEQCEDIDFSSKTREVAESLFQDENELPEEGLVYEDGEEDQKQEGSEKIVEPEIEEEEEGLEGLDLNDLPIEKGIIEKLNFYDIYLVEEYIELGEDDFKAMDKLTPEDIVEVNKIINENVELVETEVENEEEEEFVCPSCGCKITSDMTECPNCHIGLSFE